MKIQQPSCSLTIGFSSWFVRQLSEHRKVDSVESFRSAILSQPHVRQSLQASNDHRADFDQLR
jgi:glutaredoxin-related protein